MARKQQTESERLHRLVRARRWIRVRDVIEAGLHPETLRRLYRAGDLERVARGLYTLPGTARSRDSSLVEASRRTPNGVICLLSALRFHALTTQAPFEVWIAIGAKDRAPVADGVQIRFVRMSPASLRAGVEHHVIDGVRVAISSIAKTVADCFKYRSTVGLDVAIEALGEALRGRRATVDDIWRYATVDRVASVIKPYLQALAR